MDETGPETVVRPNLFGFDRSELVAALDGYDAPAFHAKQIYRWLYARRSFSPSSWTDLSQDLRSRLGHDLRIDPGRVTDRVEARDGTVKYRIDLAAGGVVESVYMEQSDRITLCISSQVGCALDCAFCLTGKMGFGRHLDPGEIAGQVALVQDDKRLDERRFNIVFMGMGEPLHNYDGVLAAFRLLTDSDGFGLSRRRITISTSGLVPAIERLAAEPLRPLLAVSLNASTDAVRDEIMPINRKYPIRKLVDACAAYASSTGDAFTFEYVLLRGVNDSEDDMRRLAALVHGLPAKLNLIPFNPVPGWLDYQPPPRKQILRLRDDLLSRGLRASIRWSRGADARAACGQLALLPEGKDA